VMTAMIRAETKDPNCELIGEIAREVYPQARVILFGSRAREQRDEHSDYDVLVIVRNDVQPEGAAHLETEIRKRLAQKLIPADVIVETQEYADRSRRCRWTAIYDALHYGVEL